MSQPPADPYWREAMAPYARPIPLRSALDILTSVVPFFALWAAMYMALDVSYWLVLAISIPAAGFLLRTFILFHDCAHGSFFASRRANVWGGRIFALITFQAFANWRHNHAIHHGSAGDLDRRGTGDVPTWTVDEYYASPWTARIGYRLFRNPLVMFGVACLAFGWQAVLLIEIPLVVIAGTAGVWLFFVQHQFEDVYWESGEAWDYTEAALQGSSYLKLPQPLQFFTGNIGLHHVHHLSARVPSYSLQRAHDENEVFAQVPVLTVGAALRSSRLKLWDPAAKRLVGFAAAKAAHRRAGVPSRPAASAS